MSESGAVSTVEFPVARVAIDSPLPHLDRLFDYRVMAEHEHAAVSGCRVKVRFAGRLADGYIIERVDASDHDGTLATISRIVSPEPVLRPDVLSAARAVAHRYAGTLSDVLRLAIPPRHARVENQATGPNQSNGPPQPGEISGPPEPLRPLVDGLAAGRQARICWSATPRDDVFAHMAALAAATIALGRGVIICLPEHSHVQRCAAVLTSVLGGDEHHSVVTSAQKPAARYRAFLALSRGQRRIAVGTRAAAFAPVHDLGLVMIWDDGSDLYHEPRAPYPHAREVLLTRALQTTSSVLIAGYARTAEAQQLVATGWCTDVSQDLAIRRASWPQVTISDGSERGSLPVRLPHAVFAAIRRVDGPVLVQVPRRGYRGALACQSCRRRASCHRCAGPLVQPRRHSPPACSWCGSVYEAWQCEHCLGTALRAPVVGNVRTAEEFAQAFSERTVLTSHGGAVRQHVADPDGLVLATPGAEPHAAGGYALIVLLDTWLSLGREDMRAAEEAHRRWFNALALSRQGASAVAVGDPQALQALVRADPVGLARRELASRREVHLPPVARLVTVQGPCDVLAQLCERDWTPHAEVLGPVPLARSVPARGDGGAAAQDQRLVIRVPKAEAAALADELRSLSAARSKVKQPALRIEVDPLTV